MPVQLFCGVLLPGFSENFTPPKKIYKHILPEKADES